MMDESLIVRTRVTHDMQWNETEIASKVSEQVLTKLVDYVEQKRYVQLAEATGLNITVLKEVERLLYSDRILVDQAMSAITARRLKGE